MSRAGGGRYSICTLVAGAVAAVAALGVGGGAAGPQSARGNVLIPSSPRERVPLSGGTVASLNWSGYVVTSPMHKITAVSGSVIVPRARRKAGGEAATWAGIGGYRTRQLIQAGVAQNPSRRAGPRRYFAWYELLPRNATVIPHHLVRPGERINITIRRIGHDRWQLALVDVHHWRWTKRVRYRSSDASAEWILEAPTINGSLTGLAHVGVVHFGPGDSFRAGGHRRTIGRGHPTRILLVSPSGRREATPSRLAGAGRFNDCSYRRRCHRP